MKKTTSIVRLDTEFLNKFFSVKMNYDSMEKALSRAKSLQFSDKDCQPLIVEKLKLLKEYQTLKDTIINSCIYRNVIKINDFWYGIICKKNNHYDMIVQPLLDTNIESISVDLLTEKIKTKDEYEKFIEENVNVDEMRKYSITILRKADEYLNKFFDCKNSIKKDGKAYLLTAHCIKRWEERINNSNKKITTANRKLIVNELARAFQNSVEVYSNKNENFITRFFFNFKEIIFFAVSGDNIILSLWKNSYGFSDDKINAKATIMQLEHVRKIADDYKKMNDKHFHFVKNKKDVLENLNDKIVDLSSQIKLLEKQKEEYLETCDNIKAEINVSRKKLKEKLKVLKKEESLIFKQHRMINDDDNQTDKSQN